MTAASSRVKVLRRLLGEARPYYPRLALSLLLGVLAGAGSLAYTKAFPLILDGVVNNRVHDVHLLWAVVVALFAINLVSNAAGYGQRYLTAWSGLRLVATLRLRMFSRVLRLPLPEFDRWRAGEFLTRFTNDLQLMTDAITVALPEMFQVCVTLVGAVAIMFYTDWLLALGLFLFAPFVNFVVARFTKLISSRTKSAQERIADLTSTLTEVLQGERVVKAFRREDYEIRRFSYVNESFFGAVMKVTQLGQMQVPVVAMILVVALLATVVFSVREVIAGRLNSATVFQFWTAAVLTMNPINRFAALVADLTRGLVGAGRVFEILDLPVEADDDASALAPARIAGALRFENVTFAYDPQGPPILHDLSAHIEAGEIVALVGPSGAGKTTIVNLVPRFYSPQVGRITLDGIDLRELRLSALRDAIAIVPQEALLFSGTIEENIRYGRLNATRAEIEQAAREANAEEFILELPQGYETKVGERGVRLSGGQRQRISIARAVLRDPRILILDEATSALDTHSERLIDAALDELLKGRTTLIIAHRLSTVRRAGKILYIESGRVLEAGTHEDLMALGGAYAELHAVQFVG